jgi:dTDP-4-dehydrorhamnose 3,5-epimerase
MKFKENNIKGVYEIELEPHEDNRGFFVRTYDEKIFRQHKLHKKWVQENHSYSRRQGTLRGLHFQFPPNGETKIVRVVSGKVYTVFVDLRKNSSSLGKCGSMILSEKSNKMLYVPRGFALGMCTLVDNCTVFYKMDNHYSPENSGVIKWNDPDLGIKWPVDNPVISDRDSKAQGFKEFIRKNKGL